MAPRKIKGSLVVGYNPYGLIEDIVFELEKDKIIDIWLSVSGNNNKSLKSIEKYTKKYDIFCYADHNTFGFKFFTGWLPWSKTKTGKLFVKRVKDIVSKYGIAFSGTCLYGPVTEIKLKYSCNILSIQIGDPQQIGSIEGIPGIENILGGVPQGAQDQSTPSMPNARSIFESIAKNTAKRHGTDCISLKQNENGSLAFTGQLAFRPGRDVVITATLEEESSRISFSICMGKNRHDGAYQLLANAKAKIYNDERSATEFLIGITSSYTYLTGLKKYSDVADIPKILDDLFKTGLELLSSNEITDIMAYTMPIF